ncbi:hypothetical protein I549_3660 [Mycobacterium avium subsp. avium 2285 (R)]|nr:hypothetical protein I549_3660 [Mycobacterium avium subsp. avium 2285 (R)]
MYGSVPDDLVQRRRGCVRVGQVDLVELPGKSSGALRARPIGSWPPSASRSATARPIPLDAPVIKTRRDGMDCSLES